MDSYSEQIVKQSMNGKQIAIIIGTLVGVLALWAVVLFFLMHAFIWIAAASGFGVYWVASSQSWEVEYNVTNGDIDIDRIVARRSRKTIVRVRGKKIEHLLPLNGQAPAEQYDRVVMAAASPKTATWYFTYYSKKNGKTIVYFEPNEKTLTELRRGLSRQALVETDRALSNL